MEQRFRRGFTATERTELWGRWQRRESLKGIGRAFGKPSSSIYFLVAPQRGHPSCSKASLKAGIGAFGAGGDFHRYYNASISPIDSQGAVSFAFDGEPGN